MAETRAGHSIKRRLLVVLLLTTLLAWVATLLFSYRIRSMSWMSCLTRTWPNRLRC